MGTVGCLSSFLSLTYPLKDRPAARDDEIYRLS